MSKVNRRKESPFACVMDAIDPYNRPLHIANSKDLFESVREIRELTNGYAFRFDYQDEVLTKLAEFISLERLCCPFFGFVIEVEPEGGDVWLHLTGREGVKAFIQAEISEFLGQSRVFPSTSMR
jgi:hypothetical protein